MTARNLISLWKANGPLWLWVIFPLWIGAIILGLDGGTPEWGTIALFLSTVTVVMSIALFANTYSDRDEDWLYGPTNPLVAGQLDAKIARITFILQNVLGGILLIILLLVTLNYPLIIAIAVGWFVGYSYSMPPFRFKESTAQPFFFALGLALLPIVAWLAVEQSLTAQDGFIIAVAAFIFLHSFGHGITLKLRKTFLALNSGLVKREQNTNIYDLSIVGMKLKVRTAIVLEAMTTLGAFILVPIAWHLGIFDSALSIGLLTAPLLLTILGIFLRIKDPADNSPKCARFIAMAWLFIVLSIFGVALSSLIHWGFAILICIVVMIGFPLLVRIIHPWGAKSLSGR